MILSFADPFTSHKALLQVFFFGSFVCENASPEDLFFNRLKDPLAKSNGDHPLFG
jgi:hypothetical protein